MARDRICGLDDPLGKQIYVKGYAYRVIGLLGGPQSDATERSIFVPLSLATEHLSSQREFVKMIIRVDSIGMVKSVREKATKLLKKAHGGFRGGVKVLVHESRLKRVKTIVFIVEVFTYAALVFVFMLGKIGLSNVMLAAIEDRTKEIALKKALGASESVIRTQFIMESVLVSLISAILGATGGVVFVLLVKDNLGVVVSHHVILVSILLDLSFTVVIGVAAGMYPSRRASRLDIVSALRFE